MRRRLLGVSLGWLGLSMVADGIPALLLPHQLLAAGFEDATTLGLASVFAIGLAALAQPVAGHLGDRHGRWPVIWAGVAATLAGLGLLLLPGAAIVGAAVALLGVSVTQAGHQPLLPDLVPARWRGRGSGAKGAFDVGGAFVAFVILAALLGAGEVALAIGVLGAFLVVSFVVALLLLRPSPSSDRVPTPAARMLRPLDRGLVQLVAARFLFLLGVYVVGRFLVLFVGTRLGLDADGAAELGGTVLAILALVTVVTSLPAGWLADRVGRGWLAVGGGLVGGLGAGLLAVASGVEAIAAAGVLLAVGSAAFGAGTWASLVDLADSADAGRRLGIAHWGTAGAAAAAGLAGPLIDAGERIGSGVGFGLVFAGAAGLAVAGGLLAWRPAPARIGMAAARPVGEAG